MENVEIKSVINRCSLNELSVEDQELLKMAIKATDNSYAPYSKFHVGAALRLDDGTTIIGANQENAAFPAGLCAERSAIFAANAQFPERKIIALAIAARNDDGLTTEPVAPCGTCRQVMLEVETRYKQPIRILLYGTNGIFVMNSVRQILPLQFTSDSL